VGAGRRRARRWRAARARPGGGAAGRRGCAGGRETTSATARSRRSAPRTRAPSATPAPLDAVGEARDLALVEPDARAHDVEGPPGGLVLDPPVVLAHHPGHANLHPAHDEDAVLGLRPAPGAG